MLFYTTFKNTIRNIIRSKTFLLSLLLVIVVAIYEAHGVHYSKFSLETFTTIMDNDPLYVLEFRIMRQHIQNAYAETVWYALPLMCVITTMLILSHDWNDRFFEIEKATGTKPLSYISARLCAILVINVIVLIFSLFLGFYWYVFSRGGVKDMSVFTMIIDSLPRLLRYVLLMGIPCVMMYVGLTFAVGNLIKSSIAGAVAGMGYVISFYLFYLFFSAQQKFPIYFNYLSPVPMELRYYIADLDRPTPSGTYALWKAAIGFGVLVGAALIYYAVSYWRVHRREY